jgi:hypothetical protein
MFYIIFIPFCLRDVGMQESENAVLYKFWIKTNIYEKGAEIAAVDDNDWSDRIRLCNRSSDKTYLLNKQKLYTCKTIFSCFDGNKQWIPYSLYNLKTIYM